MNQIKEIKLKMPQYEEIQKTCEEILYNRKIEREKREKVNQSIISGQVEPSKLSDLDLTDFVKYIQNEIYEYEQLTKEVEQLK